MSELASDIGPTAEAVVKKSTRITPANAAEVRHITLQVRDPAFQFVEGQSIGVVVPGPHPFGNPYHVRRYSIANARPLPLQEGIDLDLLVRRCFYVDEISGEQYPGIASNYLCDADPGTAITISGPYRSPFHMPLDKRSNLLMIGTGTGVAPFRAFVQLIYERRRDWIGQVRLFYGGRSGLDLMYANDEQANLADYYDQATFKAFKALAPRSTMSSSQALEHGLAENTEEAWSLVRQPNTYVFLAGLGKVAQVFDRAMSRRAGSADTWQAIKQSLIEEKRWSELIYN
jgi:ferredoxin--NADP+ reductase